MPQEAHALIGRSVFQSPALPICKCCCKWLWMKASAEWVNGNIHKHKFPPQPDFYCWLRSSFTRALERQDTDSGAPHHKLLRTGKVLVTFPTQSDDSPLQTPLVCLFMAPHWTACLFVMMIASHTLCVTVILEFCPLDVKRAILSGTWCVPEGRLLCVKLVKGSITKCDV